MPPFATTCVTDLRCTLQQRRPTMTTNCPFVLDGSNTVDLLNPSLSRANGCLEPEKLT